MTLLSTLLYLSVQEAEVLHGLLHAVLPSHVRLAAQGAHGVDDALLFDYGGEVGFKAALTEGTRTVSHGDNLWGEEKREDATG